MLTVSNWVLLMERAGNEPLRSAHQTKPEAKETAEDHYERRRKEYLERPALHWQGMDGGEWRAIQGGWTYTIRPKHV